MFELEEPLTQEPDFTILYLIIVVVLLFATLYALFKLFKKVRIFYPKKGIDIDSIDLNNSKESAYLLSEYADTYAKDNPHYNELKEHLEDYKYKREVPPFDKETLTVIQKFKEALWVLSTLIFC